MQLCPRGADPVRRRTGDGLPLSLSGPGPVWPSGIMVSSVVLRLLSPTLEAPESLVQ